MLEMFLFTNWILKTFLFLVVFKVSEGLGYRDTWWKHSVWWLRNKVKGIHTDGVSCSSGGVQHVFYKTRLIYDDQVPGREPSQIPSENDKQVWCLCQLPQNPVNPFIILCTTKCHLEDLVMLDNTHVSWLLMVKSQSSFLCQTVIFRTVLLRWTKLKLLLVSKVIRMKCISLQTNIITVDSVACVITSKESYYTILGILIPDNINIHLSSFRCKVCL